MNNRNLKIFIVLFIIAPPKNKYLAIYLIKYVCHLYDATNLQNTEKSVKVDISKLTKISCAWIGTLNIVKMSLLPVIKII